MTTPPPLAGAFVAVKCDGRMAAIQGFEINLFGGLSAELVIYGQCGQKRSVCPCVSLFYVGASGVKSSSLWGFYKKQKKKNKASSEVTVLFQIPIISSKIDLLCLEPEGLR